MQVNYKQDEFAFRRIIKKYITPVERNKKTGVMYFLIYIINKFERLTSSSTIATHLRDPNYIYKFTYLLRNCIPEENNIPEKELLWAYHCVVDIRSLPGIRIVIVPFIPFLSPPNPHGRNVGDGSEL